MMIVTHDDDLEIDEKKIKIISRNFDLQYMNPIKIVHGGGREIPLRKEKKNSSGEKWRRLLIYRAHSKKEKTA